MLTNWPGLRPENSAKTVPASVASMSDTVAIFEFIFLKNPLVGYISAANNWVVPRLRVAGDDDITIN